MSAALVVVGVVLVMSAAGAPDAPLNYRGAGVGLVLLFWGVYRQSSSR